MDLYGEDARIFLLRCLMEEIDFRDSSRNNAHHKDHLKIQLLTHEISQASTKPNFTTAICEAMQATISGPITNGNNNSIRDGSPFHQSLTEEFLHQFCKLLKLPIPQQIAIGVALVQQNPSKNEEVWKFLRAKIPEISSSGATLPEDVFHALVHLILSHSASPADGGETSASSFSELLKLLLDSHLAPTKSIAVHGLLHHSDEFLNHFDEVNTIATTENAVEELMQLVTQSSSKFYNVMEEMGYDCTKSIEYFKKCIAEVIPPVPPVDDKKNSDNCAAISNQDIAELLWTIVRTRKGLQPSSGMFYHQVLQLKEEDHEEVSTNSSDSPPSSESTWNLQVLSQWIQSIKSIDWNVVGTALDSINGRLIDHADFEYLITTFQLFSQQPFPITSLFQSWSVNRTLHLNMLQFAITCAPEVLTFNDSPNKLAPFEGVDRNGVPRNQSWCSLDLVQCLLELCDTEVQHEVRQLFDLAKNSCPDILIAALAHCQTPAKSTAKFFWSSARAEIFTDLLKLYLHSRPNAPAIIHYVWKMDQKMTLYGIAHTFAAASESTPPNNQLILRIFALLCNIPEAFQMALTSKYFVFSMNLAIMGANHEIINLEEWIREQLRLHRMHFVKIALLYLRQSYGKLIPKCNITPETSHFLTVESLTVMFQALSSVAPNLGPELSVELNELYGLYCNAHPAIAKLQQSPLTPSPAAATNASVQSASSSITPATDSQTPTATTAPPSSTNSISSEEIEEKANAYFQQIYNSEQNLDEVIEMLKRFKNSEVETEQSIFICMIHNLFDEYRFFHKYPDTELRITGVLFGRLIQHQLVSHMTLSLALRYVLDALRKPVHTKLFRFGVYAVEQFMLRLPEMAQYCVHIQQISHLRQACPELLVKIDQIVKDSSKSGGELSKQQPLPSPTGSKNPAASDASLIQPGATPSDSSSLPALNVGATTASSSATAPSPVSTTAAATPITLPAPPTPPSGPQVINVENIFGEYSLDNEATNQSNLSLDHGVQDRLHFIINNISISNLESKIHEIREFLTSDHFLWLSDYLVMKRISTQPNFHTVYSILIEKLAHEELEVAILKKTFQNVRKLLTSKTITINSQERSLLKNLGSWLGIFTLSRNKPLLQRELDVKELLYVGYETGHLIAVTPFVAKILDGSKKSKIFRPPNPWIMGILRAMREIYDVPDLKLNIKFEMEVLCKALNLQVMDLAKETILQTRKRPSMIGNPDFNNKTPKVPKKKKSSLAATVASADSKLKNSTAVSTNSSTGPNSTPGSTTNYPGIQDTTVIPNLAAYVSINPQIPLFQQNANLKRAVPVAVDRAIREIIQPVVERSVTIACITTRELIVKDFAIEGDESKMRKAAHLMVSNLAGSLALVTCKEPLRVSIGNHLRQLFTSVGVQVTSPAIENVIQIASQENLELGCMLIEKAATEKAMRDIDESLATAYASRRRHREQRPQQAYYDAAIFAPTQRYPRALPEPFRPTMNGLSSIQLQVYDAFQRIPRQPVVPSTGSSSRSSSPPSSSIPITSTSTSSTTGTVVTPSSDYPPPPPSNTASVTSPSLPASSPRAADNSSSDSPSSSNSEYLIKAAEHLTNILDIFERIVHGMVRQLPSGRECPRLSALPQDHEVYQGLQQILALANFDFPTAQIRTEVCLHIGQVIFKRCYQLGERGDELLLEILMVSMLKIVDSCPSLRKEIPLWIIRAPVEDKIKLHCEIMVSLLHSKILKLSEMDMYLARNMERNLTAIEFAIHIIRQCLPVSFIIVALEIPTTIETLDRIYQRHGGNSQAGPQMAVIAQVLEMVKSNYKEFMEKNNSILSSVPTSPTAGAGSTGLFSLLEGTKNLSPLAAAGNTNALLNAGAATNVTGSSTEMQQKQLRVTVSNAMEHWLKVCKEANENEKMHLQYLNLLKQYGFMKDEDSLIGFFKVATELCIETSLKFALSSQQPPVSATGASPLGLQFNYTVLDAFSKLIVLIMKYADPNVNVKLNVLNKALTAIVQVLLRQYEQSNASASTSSSSSSASSSPSHHGFDQRLYFRIFMNLMRDLILPPTSSSNGNATTAGKPTSPSDQALEPIQFQILSTFAQIYNRLQPVALPGFAFAWFELISHRCFLPRLLSVVSNNKSSTGTSTESSVASGDSSPHHLGWTILHRLLSSFFMFLEPFLRTLEMSPSIRMLYQGGLRVMLLLLHDFAEFLCEFYFSFCNVLPSTCVQLRNLILSAIPRTVRLPDPLTPGLSMGQLTECFHSPRITSNVIVTLTQHHMQAELLAFLNQDTTLLLGPKSKFEIWFTDVVATKLSVLPVSGTTSLSTASSTTTTTEKKKNSKNSSSSSSSSSPQYNVPLINSLVLYLGMVASSQLQQLLMTKQQSAESKAAARVTTPEQLLHQSKEGKEWFQKGRVMECIELLLRQLDAEGRYYVFCSMVNHLRFPNSHTFYFSQVLLHFFRSPGSKTPKGSKSNKKNTDMSCSMKEQITRVLLERLIAHRPHPWGLLVTFIELIRNPQYRFWEQSFLECSNEIKLVFDDVARNCMGSASAAGLSPLPPVTTAAST